MMAAQLATETSSSSSMTACTTKLACKMSWKMESSWFMVGLAVW